MVVDDPTGCGAGHPFAAGPFQPAGGTGSAAGNRRGPDRAGPRSCAARSAGSTAFPRRWTSCREPARTWNCRYAGRTNWRAQETSFNRMAALSRDKAEAEARLARQRSEMVTAVSHDLRSPLTGLLGYLGEGEDDLGPAQPLLCGTAKNRCQGSGCAGDGAPYRPCVTISAGCPRLTPMRCPLHQPFSCGPVDHLPGTIR